MPFNSLKFFGATVKDFKVNMGWGGTSSTAEVIVVEDFEDGDFFVPVGMNQATAISFYALQFNGLLTRWVRNLDVGGGAVYNITIEDPRKVLEGTSLVMTDYFGNTSVVPNLINVYGYLENISFGNAQLNESGIPWIQAKSAITAITNGSASTWGGPLRYSDQTFFLDLSEVPQISQYYRVSSANLLELISTVCADAGMDFFVELVGLDIIKIRTVLKRFPPTIGTINDIVNSFVLAGLSPSASYGLTATSDVTSSYIVGAKKEALFTLDATALNLVQYFGQSINNSPYYVLYNATNPPDDILPAVCRLNSSEIVDIVLDNGLQPGGANETTSFDLDGYEYVTTMRELIVALNGSIDDWSNFFTYAHASAAATLKFTNPIANASYGSSDALVQSDVLNLTQTHTQNEYQGLMDETTDWVRTRFYNFVRKAAENFVNRQYLIPIPDIESYVDPNSGDIVRSLQPIDRAWQDPANPPLSLLPANVSRIASEDNRYPGLAVFRLQSGVDFNQVAATGFLIQGELLYVPVDIDLANIYTLDDVPHVRITIPTNLTYPVVDGLGMGIDIIAGLFGPPSPESEDVIKNQGGGNYNPYINGLPFFPSYFAIPLRENRARYGPYYAVGAEGHTAFRVEESLAPWVYGNEGLTNSAGASMVQEALIFSQLTENGFVEVVGPPSYNLGDVIQAGGPVISNITVGYGQSGVSTRYTFEGYMPFKFGGIRKQTLDRLQRTIASNNHFSRELENIQYENIRRGQDNVINAKIDLIGTIYKNNFGYSKQKNTKHNYIIGQCIPAEVGVRQTIAFLPDKELARNLNNSEADEEAYRATIAMSLDGFIRPFTTDYFETNPNNYMSQFREPEFLDEPDAGLHAADLNPFQDGHDTDIITRGDEFTDPHSYINDGPVEEDGVLRGMCLKAPLVLTGWGYDLEAVPVPDDEGDFIEDYLKKPNEWLTGPVDFCWDRSRGLWTMARSFFGKTDGVIAANSSGTATVYIDPDCTITPASDKNGVRLVYNVFGQSIPVNTKIIANWIPENKAWYIIAADCP